MRRFVRLLWEGWKSAKEFHEHHAFYTWCGVAIPSLVSGVWGWLARFDGLAVAIIMLSVAVLFLMLLVLVLAAWRFWTTPSSTRPDYLSDIETELSMALWVASMKSAWAKWFAAQPGVAKTDDAAQDLGYVISILASKVCDNAMNGELEIRGRAPDQIAYTTIPRETWRLAALGVVRNSMTIWKVTVIPRSGVEQNRIRDVLGYDSLIVDSRQFEALYPSKQNW
jgi:hypothetical protein